MGKINNAQVKSIPREPIAQADSIPLGVKLIAWSRTVRWVGWGFGEALIPIFIFSFSHTFAEAGLFRSVVDVIGLLALPIIGMWVDRTSARRLILISLLIYPLVGIGYFLAGITGLAIFIVLARAVNGFVWQLEDIGVGTYYRRLSARGIIGSAFGYIDTFSNLGWILAALAGIALLPFVPIHFLLLAISPFAIIAYFVARRAPKDEVLPGQPARTSSMIAPYKEAFAQCRAWNRSLWLLCALSVFTGIIGVLMWFFIPIDAYINGAKPALVVLLTIVATIPSLFGYLLGKVADKGNKYALLSLGLVGVVLVMVGLAIFPTFAFKMVASFLLGILLEFFSVIERSLITTLGSPETYGERQGTFDSISTLGSLAAPLLMGVMLDSFGFSNAAVAIAAVAGLFAIEYFFLRNRAPEC